MLRVTWALSEADLDARSSGRGYVLLPHPHLSGATGPEKWANHLWESKTAENHDTASLE